MDSRPRLDSQELEMLINLLKTDITQQRKLIESGYDAHGIRANRLKRLQKLSRKLKRNMEEMRKRQKGPASGSFEDLVEAGRALQ